MLLIVSPSGLKATEGITVRPSPSTSFWQSFVRVIGLTKLFPRYFEEQNAIVAAGNGNGLLKINLKTLGIGNGLTVGESPPTLPRAILIMSTSNTGPPRTIPQVHHVFADQPMYVVFFSCHVSLLLNHAIDRATVSASTAKSINTTYYKSGGCKDQVIAYPSYQY